MALKPCKECGREISTKAKSCPHCGADPPQPAQMGLLSSLAVIFLVIFIVSSITTLFEGTDLSNNKPPSNSTEALKKIETKKESEFKQNRDSILSKGRHLITKKNYDKALNNLEKYKHINDKELQGLIKKAKEKKLAHQIKGVPASDLKQLRNIYQELAQIKPNNKKYSKKLKFYQTKINKKKEKALLARVKKVPSHHLKENRDLYRRLARLNPKNKKYKQKINLYQGTMDWLGKSPVKSAWDGSYRPVKNYLEIVMHDPDSLDLVGCTDVYHNKKGWLVGCVYRGNNAFGAKFKNAHWFLIRQNAVVKQFEADAFKWD